MALELVKSVQVVAARICIMGGDGQGGGCNGSHGGSDISSNYIGGCSGIGVGSETGSGEDGSGDRVMDTSDSGAGGGGSGIAHTRGTGNTGSGYSGGESGASVAPAAAVDHFTPKIDLNPVIAVVAASTTPDVSSVAFAAPTGANENGSGCGDFEKHG